MTVVYILNTDVWNKSRKANVIKVKINVSDIFYFIKPYFGLNSSVA